MYPRQEAAQLRKQFWTILGQYLGPIPSANGNKVNWINYKTGVRFINFKMDAGKGSACIAIEISHQNPGQRKLYYQHFAGLQNILDQNPESWVWNENSVTVDGRVISRIYSDLDNVNVYNRENWPAMISFFKSRITGIDRFWVEYKELFEMIG